MTDYVRILSRAVADKAGYEDRRGVYERARQALVAQLRNLDPPLPEGDITKQRLALETAIREVEVQASSGQPMAEINIPAVSSLEPRASENGGMAVEAAISDKPQEAAAPVIGSNWHTDADSQINRLATQTQSQEKGDPALMRVRTYPQTNKRDRKRPGNLLVIVSIVALVALGGILAAWFMVKGDVSSQTDASGAKISDRVAQDESLAGQNAAVTQTAYLVEENIEAQKGVENFRGKVAWRAESEDNAQGQGPEKVIRGVVDIPERGLKMRLTIRRNTDPALPASHTIELVFNVAPNFAHGAVESIAGIRMKPSEQANGLPLASAAVRVTTGFFLVAMSAGADDTNTVLLRDRPWMDVLLLYRNGRRAVLTIEKGIAGENVFNETFKSWGSAGQATN